MQSNDLDENKDDELQTLSPVKATNVSHFSSDHI